MIQTIGQLRAAIAQYPHSAIVTLYLNADGRETYFPIRDIAVEDYDDITKLVKIELQTWEGENRNG